MTYVATSDNSYTAMVAFTHGNVTVTGTMIFVLAKITELEKEEGFVYVDKGERLIKALEHAAGLTE